MIKATVTTARVPIDWSGWHNNDNQWGEVGGGPLQVRTGVGPGQVRTFLCLGKRRSWGGSRGTWKGKNARKTSGGKKRISPGWEWDARSETEMKMGSPGTSRTQLLGSCTEALIVKKTQLSVNNLNKKALVLKLFLLSPIFWVAEGLLLWKTMK